MTATYQKSVEPVLEAARAFEEEVNKLYSRFIHLDRKSDRLFAASLEAIARSRQLLVASGKVGGEPYQAAGETALLRLFRRGQGSNPVGNLNAHSRSC